MIAIVQASVDLPMRIKSNRTEVYYRRIPKDEGLVELMDRAILEAAKGSFKVSEWLKDEYGVVAKDVFPLDGPALKKMATDNLENQEVKQLRAENLKLKAKIQEYESMYG